MFDIFYYGGLAACGIQGAERAHHSPVPPAFFLLISIASAFGGGFIRDSLLLHIYPTVFTRDAIPGIAVAAIAGYVFLLAQSNPKYGGWIKKFSLTCDAMGLGTFIAYGVDNATAKRAPLIITILSGIITALGGSLVCSIICGTPIRKALSSNFLYKIVAIIGSFLYLVCQINYGTWVAHGIIIIYTGVSVFIANRGVRHHIISTAYLKNMFICFATPYRIIFYILISLSKDYFNTFFGNVYQNDYHISQSYITSRLLTLLLHRLHLGAV